MATRRLTELTVQKARAPAAGQLELWDGTIPGFGLRITARGTRSWILVYRIHGRARRLTLGRWPLLGLAEARQVAWDSLRMVQNGEDPALARGDARERARRDTFESVVREFINRHSKPRNRSWRETERLLRRELVASWGRRPITSIKRRDIIDALDAIMDRGAPVVANRTLAALRKMLNWAVERGILESSPAVRIAAPARVTSRDRVLTDDELARVWLGCEQLGWPFGPMFMMLILTAQRRAEVASMRWQDVDLDVRRWTLPRELTKSDRAHSVPLSSSAVDLLKHMPRVGDAGLVFPARSRVTVAPASGFSHAKARLDAVSGVTRWRLHDLRRTASSGMARLAVPPHVIERILNHASSGTLGAVGAVYNRFGYEPEMRRALDAWDGHVAGLAVRQR